MITFSAFDETNPRAWTVAAAISLLLSVAAVFRSAELLAANLALSFVAAAAVGWLALRGRLRGQQSLWQATLASWWLSFGALWISPLAHLVPELARLVASAAVMAFALSVAAPVRWLQLALLLLSTACAVAIGPLHNERLSAPSLLAMVFGFTAAAVILSLRQTRSRRESLETALHAKSEILAGTLTAVTLLTDRVLAAREQLLGLSSGKSEDTRSRRPGDPLPELGSWTPAETAVLQDTLQAVRNVFAGFQQSGRASGRIVGPVRFVFFPPAAGFSTDALVVVGIGALTQGLETVLQQSFVSLPEIAGRRREGVIRLAIRFGLRTMEISVEDNGRGLPAVESAEISSLRESIQRSGGKLERISKLGVGSRTVIELPIVKAIPLPLSARPTRSRLEVARPVESEQHA